MSLKVSKTPTDAAKTKAETITLAAGSDVAETPEISPDATLESMAILDHADGENAAESDTNAEFLGEGSDENSHENS